MIVELIGLPGSGKTFLVDKLLLKKGQLFIKYEQTKKSKISRIISLFAFFKTWIFVYFLIKIFFSKSTFSWKIKFKRLRSLIYLEAYPPLKTNNIIYDQHVVQNLISFCHVSGITISSRQLLAILNYFNFSRKMIFVYKKNDINTTLNRFVNRRNSFNHNKTILDNLANKELMVALNDLDAIIESIHLLMKKEGLNIIRFSEDIDDVSTLIDAINNNLKTAV